MSLVTEVPTIKISEAKRYITRAFKKKRPIFVGSLSLCFPTCTGYW